MNGCDGYKGRRIDRVHYGVDVFGKARTPAARFFAPNDAGGRIKLTQSPPAEKTDFLALAMMQTKSPVQAPRTKRQTLSSSASMAVPIS